jgi:hypothetical protein
MLHIRDFYQFSYFSGSLQVFELFFELNGYYLFTKDEVQGTVKIKILANLKKNSFYEFFSSFFALSY